MAILGVLAQASTASPTADQVQLADLMQEGLFYVGAALLCGVLAVLVHFRVIRRMQLTLGQLTGRAFPWWQQALDGCAAVTAVHAPMVGILLALGAYRPDMAGYSAFAPLLTGSQTPPGWFVWLFFMVQSSTEEFLFRGVGMALLACLVAWLINLLGSLAETPSRGDQPVLHAQGTERRLQLQVWFHAGLAANIVVSVGFASVHSENEHVNALALLNIALAGLALGQLYWLHGSIVGACVMHAVWNAALATLGLPVSGYVLRGPIVGSIQGSVPGMLTGGAFGPEASVLATTGLTLVWLWLVWLCWRKAHSFSAVA
jgi:membrane protease YdiL (CAAX protease family)